MLKKTFAAALAITGVAFGSLLLVLPTPSPVIAEDALLVSADNGFVITDLRLFDGETITEKTDVLVKDGKIFAIGPDILRATDMQVVQGAGKTLLPGLIDAHTHTYGAALENSVRFGVTANLDMFTAPSTLADSKVARVKWTATKKADLFSAGMLATAPGGHGSQYGVPIETLTSPDAADAWVVRRLAEGSDFIKLVYIPGQQRLPSLDLKTATALINAAHDHGLKALAHISQQQAADEMLDAGIDGLVHIFADSKVTKDFTKKAASKGVFIIPTLSVIAAISGDAGGKNLSVDPRVGPYLNAQQKQGLQSSFNVDLPDYNLEIARENIRLLHQAGVDILAGSDAPNPGTTHGASLHQEMALLVSSGFSSLEALKAATSKAAQHFKLAGRGRIAVGSRADLILVDGDPSKDITATRAISMVIKNGFPVERPISKTIARTASVMKAVIGDFKTDLTGPEALPWVETSDKVAGGKSSAKLTFVGSKNDTSRGEMHVKARIKAGFSFPWAGAFLPLSRDFSEIRSIAPYETMKFEVRGKPGIYRVMFFSPGAAGAPSMQNFDITEDWRTVTLKISNFRGLDTGAVAGIAVVAGPAVGDFDYSVRAIKFE